MKDFKDYLNTDVRSGATVRLDLHVAPWEVVGEIVRVGDKIFKIRCGDDKVKTYNIEDIRHYRLA